MSENLLESKPRSSKFLAILNSNKEEVCISIVTQIVVNKGLQHSWSALMTQAIE